MFPGFVKATNNITSTLVDAQTGNILWQEKQKLAVSATTGVPPAEELNRTIYTGIADRLVDIRTGRTPSQAKEGGGVFDCGGMLNFASDCKKATKPAG